MYPNSDLSAGQLTIMAVVVVAVLAAWLIAVFLAARQPREKSAAVSAGRRDEETAATVTQLPSDDRPSGKAAALSGITPRRGAPAPGMTAGDAGDANSAGHGRRRW
jgi:predicted metal-binding membrane protein